MHSAVINAAVKKPLGVSRWVYCIIFVTFAPPTRCGPITYRILKPSNVPDVTVIITITIIVVLCCTEIKRVDGYRMQYNTL